ncbi:hypothetical protein D3C80_1853860 [compost metagenome]
MARNNILHTKEELSGNQYLMIRVAADNSAAMVMAQLYQKFQPIAKPRDGSTKREAYVSKDPESGTYVASSPRLVIRKYTMMPTAAYASSAPPGPAEAIAPPLARNNPVPIEPPRAIIVICRA